MMMCSFGKEQPFAPRWPNNPIRIESSPTRPKNIAIQRTNFDSPESTGVNPRDEPTVNRADITSKMMLLIGCPGSRRIRIKENTNTKVKTGDHTKYMVYMGLIGSSLLGAYCIIMKNYIH